MSIYQIVTVGESTGGNAFRNVHHYEFPEYVPDATELQEFIDNFDADHRTYIQTYLHESIQILGYDVRRVDVGDLPGTRFVQTVGTWVGSSSANKLPNQLAALITWRTTTAYPRTSRMFCFPMTEDVNTAGGALTAALLTALGNFANAVVTIDVTGQADPYKVAVKYGGDPRAVTDSNIVNLTSVNVAWKTQRRRVAGFGI